MLDPAVAATCEKAGKTEGIHCSVCGKVLKEQQDIPALGHKESIMVVNEATCETSGIELPYCSTCKKILGEKKEIPATGHSFTGWVKKTPATVFKAATRTRSCTVCQKTETETYGKKLTPAMKTSVNSLLLKTKQKTTVLKVSGLRRGDSIVSWRSGNTGIVKVSGKSNGTSTITAGSRKGTTTITIRLKSGLQKNIKVTVQQAAVATSKISGIPGSLTLKKGQSRVLKPVLAPVTSQQKITYTSDKKSVATVTSGGKITAKAKGTAVITVKSGTKTVKCKVTVN